MYSKWIMVSALMTTNLFTLFTRLKSSYADLPVPVFGCLQNLIVKFKDHDYDVLTDWSYDYWLYIFECVFSSRPGTIVYHYVIANDVITLGRKRTDEPVHWNELSERTGLQKRTGLPITSLREGRFKFSRVCARNKWAGINMLMFHVDITLKQLKIRFKNDSFSWLGVDSFFWKTITLYKVHF